MKNFWENKIVPGLVAVIAFVSACTIAFIMLVGIINIAEKIKNPVGVQSDMVEYCVNKEEINE